MIPWERQSVAHAHKLLRETQQLLETDDPDALLDEIEPELDGLLLAWAEGDPAAAGEVDAYYIMRGLLRYHRTTRFIRDLAAHGQRRKSIDVLIDAVTAAGRAHQDWSWAQIEVTAGWWGQAEDEW